MVDFGIESTFYLDDLLNKGIFFTHIITYGIERGSIQVLLIAVSYSGVDLENAILLSVKLIESKNGHKHGKCQEAYRHAEGQSHDVDDREELLFLKVSDGYFEIILEHGHGVVGVVGGVGGCALALSEGI